METPSQLATQIRFHLETLGETNAHHPFEQLCLGLTRRRIVSNLMPATGPVAAGGDDGRDGESYWSAIATELPNTSLFTALATNQDVVIAVTTQRDDVPSKVRNDLAKICAPHSRPIDRVIYFTVTAVPVAKRHELQQHATDTYSVALDIWDAQAIAEAIADHDLFHLAVDYLHVPSSLTPPRPDTDAELPEWYLEERAHWRTSPDCHGTMGEFVDLRDALRYAALNDEARADLPDWLATARILHAAAGNDPALLSRIEYEVVLCTTLGMNTLIPADRFLREFFTRQQNREPDLGVLVDSITMLRMAETMQVRRLTRIRPTETSAWADNLEQILTRMLEDDPYPNARAQLLCAAAILALGPPSLDPETRQALDPSTAPDIAEVYRSVSQAKAEGSPMPPLPADAEVHDLDQGMVYLVELAALLPTTPLVPIEHLTAMFDMATPLLVDHPDYPLARQALDEATVERAGMAAAGERAQARAVGLLQVKRPVDALREIHAAKIDWLHGEAVEGAALMMLLAAQVYYELRLPIAAKQYAMSAASVARSSEGPELAALIARGFLVAATCEHLAGQWLTATRTFRIGIWAQGALAGDPWSLERHPHFKNMLIDQCFILRTARALSPQFLPVIEPIVESTQLDDMVEPMLASVGGLAPPTEAEAITSTERAGMGRPFSDAGPTRRYTWAALGNVWIVTTPNRRESVMAAERFVAATQIALADLAREDLLLVPGRIAVEVAVTEENQDLRDVFLERGEAGTQAHQVVLTRGGLLDIDRGQLEVTSAAMQTIATQSLLSRASFTAVMERTFERGLPHMLTCVRPYDELADVHDAAFYDELSALEDAPFGPDDEQRPQPARDLDAPRTDKPGEGYDQSTANRAITARYDNLLPPVRLTLTRLADDPRFMEMVGDLRSTGWKDWHLLTAVANITVNARAVQRGINMTTTIGPEDLQQFRALMFAEELVTDPAIPAEMFTKEEMWFHLANAARSTAETWGLEVRLSPLEPEPFLSVLGERYRYWSDDVPHSPLFP